MAWLPDASSRGEEERQGSSWICTSRGLVYVVYKCTSHVVQSGRRHCCSMRLAGSTLRLHVKNRYLAALLPLLASIFSTPPGPSFPLALSLPPSLFFTAPPPSPPRLPHSLGAVELQTSSPILGSTPACLLCLAHSSSYSHTPSVAGLPLGFMSPPLNFTRSTRPPPHRFPSW